MNPKLPIALLGTALFLMSPVASANPAPGTTDNCLGGGYNPSALANVCYANNGPSTPDHTGQVTVVQGPCIIGQTCVPVPSYDPNGGTTIPSVTVPTLSYTDINTSMGGCEAPVYNGRTVACDVDSWPETYAFGDVGFRTGNGLPCAFLYVNEAKIFNTCQA
jgi:hypothetical protein